MVDPSVLPAFVLAVVAVTVAPGPDNTYIAAVALRHGPRAGVVSALGMACGMVVHVTAAALGLAALLRLNPEIVVGVQLVGAAYLGWLAVDTVRGLTRASETEGAPATGRVLVRATLTNLTNPKVILFFAAFLPGFVADGHGPAVVQLLTLGTIFLVVGLVCDVTIGVVAGRLGRALDARGRAGTTLTAVAACVYAGLALLLLVEALRTITP
ncbi:LysE family translocator [Mumia zhuanghuii]|uniref:LysE family translocator n=1 Tax=Mumia zhuanghuii TaxID=2585211 RepID=A0A5C4MNC7_9ACTN|nr:LysE family translocator [Mumia zhuanghuii]TNC45891.1 LysE family translocator [Mumia zhuanghuii]